MLAAAINIVFRTADKFAQLVSPLDKNKRRGIRCDNMLHRFAKVAGHYDAANAGLQLKPATKDEKNVCRL